MWEGFSHLERQKVFNPISLHNSSQFWEAVDHAPELHQTLTGLEHSNFFSPKTKKVRVKELGISRHYSVFLGLHR